MLWLRRDRRPKRAKPSFLETRIRHGLLSWKPTIPGLEKAKDWETHLDRTLQSLTPVGYTEILLAERAALLMWRLSRVARYEREATAIALEHAESAAVRNTRLREQSVVAAQAVVTLTEGLRSLPPETKLNPDEAVKVLAKAASEAKVDIYENEEIAWAEFMCEELLVKSIGRPPAYWYASSLLATKPPLHWMNCSPKRRKLSATT